MAGAPDLSGNQATKDVPSHLVDLSPAATTVAFDPVIPLLRVPVPAGEEYDPSKGPFVLAFKDEATWRRAWHNCETKIAEQCEAGARMGCSINAAKKCKPPWWHNMFPFSSGLKGETEDREACEQQEMITCLTSAKDRCADYARDTCRTVFTEARIAEPGQPLDSRFNQNYTHVKRWSEKDVIKPVQNSSVQINDKGQCTGSESPSRDLKMRSSLKKTNFQGKILLGDESCPRSWEGPVWIDGIAQVELAEREESAITGWEGGLVRPKIYGQKLETPESDKAEPAIAVEQALWKQFEEKIRASLEQLRL